MKWLIEITRDHFQNILKERVRDLPNILSGKTKKTTLLSSGQKLANCINVIRPQSMAKGRPNAPTRTQADQSEQGVINNPSWSEFPRNSSPRGPENKSVLVLSGKTLKNQSKDQPRYSNNLFLTVFDRYLRSQTNPRETPMGTELTSPIDHIQVQVQGGSYILNQSINFKGGKRGSELGKSSINLIQLYVPVTNHSNVYTDVLEDLDSYQGNLPPQVLSLYKSNKKNRDTQLVTIDLEKKRELITHMYKNMYYRNWEVERTVTNFQSKMFQDNKIDYEPNNKPRKGEGFCENYSINFAKRFPHVLKPIATGFATPTPSGNVQNNSTFTSTINAINTTAASVANTSALQTPGNIPSRLVKSSNQNVKKDSPPASATLTQANQNQETIASDITPVSSYSPKNVRSTSLKQERIKRDIEYRHSASNEPYFHSNTLQNENQPWEQDLSQSYVPTSTQTLNVDNPTKSTEIEEGYSRKKSGGLGFGYRSENHFRIVSKKVSLFQDGKLGPEDKSAKGSKPSQENYWMNSEETPHRSTVNDDLSERSGFQTITSRREVVTSYKSTVRHKSTKISQFNQDKRSWSTEKSRPISTIDDQGRALARYRDDMESDLAKTIHKSYNNNQDPDQEQRNTELAGEDKIYGDHLLREDCDTVANSTEATEPKKTKLHRSKQKPLSAVPRLHPRHAKSYNDALVTPQKG